eukprot:16436036-Heterocapsa_arctica.AAC.1
MRCSCAEGFFQKLRRHIARTSLRQVEVPKGVKVLVAELLPSHALPEFDPCEAIWIGPFHPALLAGDPDCCPASVLLVSRVACAVAWKDQMDRARSSDRQGHLDVDNESVKPKDLAPPSPA